MEAGLSQKERFVLGVSALCAAGRTERLERELVAARERGVASRELEEAVLVSSLFVGFPRALVAMQLVAEVMGLDGGSAGRAAEPEPFSEQAGEAVFRAIHGPTADAQLAMIGSLPAAFRRSLLGHAYGSVLGRDVLDHKLKELVAVSCLAVLELPRVLKAHALAARRHGATPAQLVETIERTAELTGCPTAEPLRAAGRAARQPRTG